MIDASFVSATTPDAPTRGLALRLSDGDTLLESGQLGGPGAPAPFVKRGARSVYVDRLKRVAGVSRAVLLPGATLPDGRRKWTVKLTLDSTAAAALAAPVAPRMRVRVDAAPPCAASVDEAMTCAWRPNGAVLRCSRR